MPSYGTLILGNNDVSDAEYALSVGGVEVFRLHSREDDRQFVVDFDLRDASGIRLATIAKNNAVHLADGFRTQSQPRRYRVFSQRSGQTYATVEGLSSGVIRLTGTFCVDGFQVTATARGLMLPGNKLLSGCRIKGVRTPILLSRDCFGIGIPG
jgi:hypothetical protein